MGFEMGVMILEGEQGGRLVDQGMGQGRVEGLNLEEVEEECHLHRRRQVGDTQRNIMEEISRLHLPCHCTMAEVEFPVVLMGILEEGEAQ